MKTLLTFVLLAVAGFFAYNSFSGYLNFFEQAKQPAPKPVPKPVPVTTVQSTPPPSKIEFKEVRDLRTWNQTQSGGIEPTLDTSRSVPANRNPAYRSEPASQQSDGK